MKNMGESFTSEILATIDLMQELNIKIFTIIMKVSVPTSNVRQ